MKYAAGQLFGRYELLVPIAKGGMAEVWAARLRGSRGFQKIVAIKTIRPGTTDDARMEQMFLEEATLASEIHHPNVVGTIELGEHEGALYLVMEWVEGESLNFIMKRAADQGGIPIPISVNLIAQACKGLQAAHDLRDETGVLLGVVHRDISPHNILVTCSGTAKLVDFGIAKVTARASDLTEAGELKGKFAYMAPEQMNGATIDRRADIFGMGIVLYLLTTGRHPFQGEHPAETLQNISVKAPLAPSSIVEGYPLPLEEVVLKALSKDPAHRWSTAHEMLSALELAMPQCHEGSFELRIAEFMKELVGDRSRERRARLRIAQELADQALPPESRRSVPTPSVGSLRAVSFDGAPPTSNATLPSLRLSNTPALREPNETPSRQRTKKSVQVLAAVALASMVVAGLSFVTRWHDRQWRGMAATTPVRAAPPGPAAAPPTGTPVAAPPSSALAAGSAAPAGAPNPPKVPTEGRTDVGEAERVQKEAGAPQRPAAPHSKPTSRPKTPQPETGAQAPSPERAPASDGPNVWDRRF
jgi:serine/threonine protein kinase